MSNDYGLVMWGPKASGKTSFLGAFSNALSHLSINNTAYDYRLFWDDPDKKHPFITDRSLRLQEVSPVWSKEYEEPTSTQGHKRYLFNCSSKKDYKRLVSYPIGAFDAGGDDLLRAVDRNAQQADPIIRAYLDGCDSFIATFDLEEIIKNVASKKDSLEALKNLMRYLASKNEADKRDIIPPINLAICMNKIDLVDLRWNNPEIIYKIAFGEPLKNLEFYYKGKVNIKVFATSVMGFFESNFAEYSNYHRQNRRPQLVDKWMPWNVHAPFFWIFEQWKNIERRENVNWFNSLFQPSPSKSYYTQSFF